MNSNLINALVFSQIQNNIPQTNNRYDTVARVAGGRSENSLNNLINQTTIKRACCMAKNSGGNNKTTINGENYYTIAVKIPTPENYVYGEDTISLQQKKFGYVTSEVNVPASMCSSFDPEFNIKDTSTGSFNKCNDFYTGYCENQKYLYLSENNQDYDAEEFYNFSNFECACYQDLPSSVPQNAPHSCFLQHCDQDDANITYLDPSTRSSTCSATFCTQINKIGNVAALDGGSVNVATKYQQTCGGTSSGSSSESTVNNGIQAPSTTANKITSGLPPSSTTTTPPETPSTPPETPSTSPETPSTSSTPPTTPSTSKTTDAKSTTEEEGKKSNKMYYIIGGVSSSLLLLSILLLVIILVTRKKS
jgi:hypothetical protein